jgi:hypothetical protein
MLAPSGGIRFFEALAAGLARGVYQ